VEYGVLALLVYRADVASRRDARSSGGVAFWVAVIYAITDEIHQIFVPGREATIRDFLIDALGAFLAGLFIKRNKKVPLSR
ncbi:MAG: VanZ family protein, partial [Parcubacteria group bacterium]|nr:VanZ family protein [Parcubacteria group bacterium]